MESAVVVSLGIIAAIVASYVGVIYDRGWRASLTGRSECVCGVELRPAVMVPVLSWLAAGGVAGCCGSRIPVRYPMSEAAAAVIVMFAAAGFGTAGTLIGFPVSLAAAYMVNRIFA